MEDVTTIGALRERLRLPRAQGRRIGFVPTMGALHDGHLALVDEARRLSDLVVMSVFVNPLQFAAGEDLDRYPRDLDRDRRLAQGRGVDLLFAPSAEEMYGAGRELRVVSPEIGARWEGAVRPHHFDGVLTVVAKLFNIVQPHVAVFGQKDIQQVTLVTRLIGELNMPISLRVAPTVRDADGLALSSRNAYLTTDERRRAVALSRALRAVEVAWRDGETASAALQSVAQAELAAAGVVTPDYVAVVEPSAMLPVDRAVAGTIVAIAARVGSTRLIDNVILGAENQ